MKHTFIGLGVVILSIAFGWLLSDYLKIKFKFDVKADAPLISVLEDDDYVPSNKELMIVDVMTVNKLMEFEERIQKLEEETGILPKGEEF